jgi:hypothetical protein
LCAAFGIVLHVVDEMNAAPEKAVSVGLALTNTTTGEIVERKDAVMIAPVIDESTYAVALHEIGHCLAPLGRVSHTESTLQMRSTGVPATLRDIRLKVISEEAAWEWAHAHAIEWTVVMDQVESYSIGTYRRYERKFTGGGVTTDPRAVKEKPRSKPFTWKGKPR